MGVPDMRGFLVRFAKKHPREASPDSGFSRRLTAWEGGLPPGNVKKSQSGAFTCTLFSRNGVSCESNQRLIAPSGGSMHLCAGPRIDLMAADALPLPSSLETLALAHESRLYAKGMETSILISYRTEDGSLTVKTDLLNSTFIYVLETPDWICLSNSSALLAGLSGAGLEAKAAAEFLATGSIYGNKSLYGGIATLAPSRFYKWDRAGKRTESEYWKIADIPFGTLRLDQAVDGMLAALDQDMLRLKGMGKFVFDLTGGYDSRCNLGLALRNGLKLRTTVSGGEGDEDVRIAGAIAGRYGLTHLRVPVDQRDVSEIGAGAEEAMDYTDGEYDLIEYSKTMDVHLKHFEPGEVSVHGSTADLMRNYFLHPTFYKGTPEGQVDFEGLIAKRFPALVDVRACMRPAHSFEWGAHMREQIACYDLPGLPAFARLDNIYLRIRMQFWQGRIASSTNRIHGSFTPWTGIEALHAILAAKWQEKRSHMMSRALLGKLHPGLTDFPVAGGNVAGPGAGAAMGALPRKFLDLGSRVVRKVRKPALRPGAMRDVAFLEKQVKERFSILEDLLVPDAFLPGRNGDTGYFRNPKALARVFTLITAATRLRDFKSA